MFITSGGGGRGGEEGECEAWDEEGMGEGEGSTPDQSPSGLLRAALEDDDRRGKKTAAGWQAAMGDFFFFFAVNKQTAQGMKEGPENFRLKCTSEISKL